MNRLGSQRRLLDVWVEDYKARDGGGNRQATHTENEYQSELFGAAKAKGGDDEKWKPHDYENQQGQQENYRYVLAHSLNKSVKILSHETTQLTASEPRADLLMTTVNWDDLELPSVNLSIPITTAA